MCLILLNPDMLPHIFFVQIDRWQILVCAAIPHFHVDSVIVGVSSKMFTYLNTYIIFPHTVQCCSTSIHPLFKRLSVYRMKTDGVNQALTAP